MPVVLHLLVFRKAGTSAQEFRQHYESVHLPLMRSISGDQFPVSHIRRYIPKSRSGDHEQAQVVTGSSDEFLHDAVAEITYRDMDHFLAHSAILQSNEHRVTVQDDCEKFMDVAKTAGVLLQDGDVVETRA